MFKQLSVILIILAATHPRGCDISDFRKSFEGKYKPSRQAEIPSERGYPTIPKTVGTMEYSVIPKTAGTKELLASQMILGSAWDYIQGEENYLQNAYEKLDLKDEHTIPDLLDMLQHKDPKVRARAVGILGYIGPVNDKIVPALAKALADGEADVRRRAAKSLGKIGDDAQPYILKALQSDNVDVHEAALHAVDYLDSSFPKKIPVFLEGLSDSSVTIRYTAAKILGDIGKYAYSAIPALIDALEDDSSWVQGSVIAALGEIGRPAAAAIPPLLTYVFNQDPDTRKAVKEAIWNIQPNALSEISSLTQELGLGDIFGPEYPDTMLPPLTYDCLTDTGKLTRALKGMTNVGQWLAADILKRIAPGAVELKPVLVEALFCTDDWVNQLAADALGDMGSDAESALPSLIFDFNVNTVPAPLHKHLRLARAKIEGLDALVPLLSDEDMWLRKNSVVALSKYPKENLPIAKFNELLSDKSWQVRDAAVDALAGAGASSNELISILMQSLRTDNGMGRRHSSSSLAELGKAGSAALLEGLKDSDKQVRFAAAQGLSEMGPEAKDAVPQLIDALQDSDQQVRAFAAMALGKIGPDAVTAVPYLVGKLSPDAFTPEPNLVAALNTADLATSYHSIEALGRIGPGAVDAIPAIMKFTEDFSGSTRLTAIMSIYSIKPDAIDAVGILIGELKREKIPYGTPLQMEDIQSLRQPVAAGAARILGIIGPPAKAAVPYLLEMLKKGEADERMAAIDSLGGIAPESAEAVAALIEALTDKEKSVKMHAIIALGNMGSAASSALPKLIALSKKNGAFDIRQAALEAIIKIETADK